MAVCLHYASVIVDSRMVKLRGVGVVRRRRACSTCTARFTTVEILDESTYATWKGARVDAYKIKHLDYVINLLTQAKKESK
jgi:transcriptional regulator NrdR family protein